MNNQMQNIQDLKSNTDAKLSDISSSAIAASYIYGKTAYEKDLRQIYKSIKNTHLNSKRILENSACMQEVNASYSDFSSHTNTDLMYQDITSTMTYDLDSGVVSGTCIIKNNTGYVDWYMKPLGVLARVTFIKLYDETYLSTDKTYYAETSNSVVCTENIKKAAVEIPMLFDTNSLNTTDYKNFRAEIELVPYIELSGEKICFEDYAVSLSYYNIAKVNKANPENIKINAVISSDDEAYITKIEPLNGSLLEEITIPNIITKEE